MSAIGFMGAFVVGAGVVAGWLDWRFDKRRPASLMRRFGHAVASFAILRGASAGFSYLVGSDPGTVQRLTLLFILVLPSLVYVLLASLWFVRTLAEIAGVARH